MLFCSIGSKAILSEAYIILEQLKKEWQKKHNSPKEAKIKQRAWILQSR